MAKKKNLHKPSARHGLITTLRNRKLKRRRSLAVDILLFLLLAGFGIFSLFPLIFTVVNAFKPMSEIFIFPPKLTVDNPTMNNFYDLSFILESFDVPMSRYIFNTAVITGLGTLGTVLLGSMAAFALSKLRFRGKKTLMEINNLAMMFVPVAVIIPRYLLIDKLGMINTFAAHILPLIAMPVGMFLVKQFTDQVPDSLIEAAIVDGAGYFRVFFKIILPLVRPAIATVAILAFQSVWNNTETSIMFTNKENMRTLTFYMNTLASNTNAVAGQGIAAAASLIMFLPNLILFICMQSKVMNTMAYSGLK